MDFGNHCLMNENVNEINIVFLIICSSNKISVNDGFLRDSGHI